MFKKYFKEDYQIKYLDEISTYGTRASATMSMSTQIIDFYGVGNYRQVRIKVSWNWSKAPFWAYTDSLGVSVSKTMYYNSSKTYHLVKYYTLGGSYNRTNAISFSPAGPKSIVKSQGIDVVTRVDWAKSGTAYVQFSTSSGTFNDIGAYAVYGHYKAAVTPSLSISSGAPSISFTPSVSVTNYKRYDYSAR